MAKKIMLLLVLMLTMVGAAMAQGKKVHGVVLQAGYNEPIVGASVQVVGTSMGAATDIDGNFTINNVPNTAKRLKISYIGMKAIEVAIKETTMRIYLEEDVKTLNDVMVVAYGEAKKQTFTGSAAVIDAERISNIQTSNVTNALSGQVAGVQTIKNSGRPGEASTILIRGIGSFNASNSPLYVVDGAPYAGDIAAINPQDIASMTVMKDAAANALYGARGANGVIIITTKQGNRSQAPRISLDAKLGSNSRGIKNYDVMTNPDAYMETLYKAMYNNRYDQLAKTLTPQKAALQANQYVNDNIFTTSGMGVGYQMYNIPLGQNLIGTNGRINPNAKMGNVIDGYYYTNDNWEDELLNSGNLRQEYNASVTGGTEKNDYFVSFGYINDTGIIPKSGFERFTGRVKNDYRLTKWLRLGENVAFTHYTYEDPADQSGDGSTGNVFYVANSIAPVYSLYVRDAKGNIMRDAQGNVIYEFGDRTTSAVYRQYVPGSNPGADLALNTSDIVSNILDASVNLEADIIDGLKARIAYNIYVDDTRVRQVTNKYYGQYSYMNGIVAVAHQRSMSHNFQQLLTYKHTFAEKHNMNLLLGHELYWLNTGDLSGQKTNLFNNNTAELGNAISNPQTNSSTNRYATEGIFFQGQYEYNTKYFGSVSYRRDASSRFVKNRWGNFWSVGGGWLINNESWLEEATWMNMLKIKASYGEQGNDAIGGYYPTVNQYSIRDLGGQIALSQTVTESPDLTWETSRNFNCGVDFSFFGYRLNGTIEFFNRQTADMLYARPVSPSSGQSSQLVNIGSVRNRGIEIDLNGTVVDNWKGLNVNLYVNATHIKNTIEKLSPELGGQYVSGNYLNKEGGSMYNLYMPKWAGVDPETGKATWWKDTKDAEGNVTGQEKTETWAEATYYELGDILPKLYGGFGLNASWRGIDFGISFAYQLGGRMYDAGYARLMHNGSSGAGMNWHKDMLNAWTPENPYTNVPRLNTISTSSYDNSVSDRFMISSNYLSLNNITVGYTLPSKWTNAIKMNKVRFYFVADNVALWSKRNGLDPRSAITSSSKSEYSILRSMSGGVQVEF